MGNKKSKKIEGYATVAEIKKMAVPEIETHNDKHFAYDFITSVGKTEIGCTHSFFQMLNLSLTENKNVIRSLTEIQRCE